MFHASSAQLRPVRIIEMRAQWALRCDAARHDQQPPNPEPVPPQAAPLIMAGAPPAAGSGPPPPWTRTYT